MPLNVAVEVPNSCQVKNTKGRINQLETGVRIFGVVIASLGWQQRCEGVIWFGFHVLYSSIDQVYTVKFALHKQNSDDTLSKTILKIGCSMIRLWL